MGPKGCKIFTMAKFPKLCFINIGGNRIQDTGAVHLSKMSLCRDLKEMNISTFPII
jgi:hypothetical protein